MLKNKKIILILLFFFLNINYSFSLDLYSYKIKDNLTNSNFKKSNNSNLFLFSKKKIQSNSQVKIKSEVSNLYNSLDNYQIVKYEKIPLIYKGETILNDNQVSSYKYYLIRKFYEIFGAKNLFKIFKNEYFNNLFNGWYPTITNEMIGGIDYEKKEYLIARKVLDLNIDSRFLGISLNREFQEKIKIIYVRDSNGAFRPFYPAGHYKEDENILIFLSNKINKKTVREAEDNFRININEIFVWFKNPKFINKDNFLKNFKIIDFSVEENLWKNFLFSYFKYNESFHFYEKDSLNGSENIEIISSNDFKKFLFDELIKKNFEKFKYYNENIFTSNKKNYLFTINFEDKKNILKFQDNAFVSIKSLKYNSEELKLYQFPSEQNRIKSPIPTTKNDDKKNINIYLATIIFISILIVLSLIITKKKFNEKKLLIILISSIICLILYFYSPFNIFVSYLYIFLGFIIALLFFRIKNIYLTILILFIIINTSFLLFKFTLIFETINILFMIFYFLFLARRSFK